MNRATERAAGQVGAPQREDATADVAAWLTKNPWRWRACVTA
jgi:hypothetical protein